MNHTTGAERYNKRADKIWERAKILNAFYSNERYIRQIRDIVVRNTEAICKDVGYEDIDIELNEIIQTIRTDVINHIKKEGA